jgi:mono/diheme cytochrome c family protein
MSLRNQPLAERAFAAIVVLALGGFLAGGLTFSIRQDRDRTSQASASRPRLMAILAGTMAPNVSPAEAAVFRTWVRGGATQEGFEPVEAIVANNCASCHGPGSQFPRITSYADLRPLALEEEAEGFYAAIGARTLHLAYFPVVFLVAAFGYLRRTTWVWRRFLLGACGAAVLFDAGQWWARGGRPEALWATWTASAVLAAIMLTLVVVVLRDLWGSKPD